MLQGKFENIDLLEMKNNMKELLSDKLNVYIDNDSTITTLKYPQPNTLEKIISINLEKTPEVIGKLTGIKGQYIIIDNLYVLNVRKYTGYFLDINFY